MFIDVHCHLDYFKSDVEKVVERARKNKVGVIVSSGVNKKSNRKTLEISEKHSEVKTALGIYPIEAFSLSVEDIDDEIEFIRKNKENR